MATKKQTPQDEKWSNQDFDLFRALEALDKKDYDYYSKLTEEQQRKFVPYMMVHWISAVKATGVLGGYYTISTDTHANKHLFNEIVQKHPELQWLMLCTVSPGLGKQFHQWIPHLSAKIANLKEAAKERDVLEYFQKIYKNVDDNTLKEVSAEYTNAQNHKYRLSRLYPDMKLEDIEIMATLISQSEIDEYEKRAGN
jgi:hypothetical protein